MNDELAPTGADLASSDAGPTVIRSEEELDVQLRTVASGRVRITKRIVTETQTRTIEVRREVLEVEHLPPEPADAGASTRDVLADETLELVLHEEEVVLTTRVVPRERVTVLKRTVTTQEPVSETVRRERVELDAPSASRPTA